MEFVLFYCRQRVLFDALEEVENTLDEPDQNEPGEERPSFWLRVCGTLDAMMAMDDETAVAQHQRRLHEGS